MNVYDRCTCIRETYWQPGETDPECPFHGYDEDTGEPISRYDPDDYDPDDLETNE